MTPEEQIAICKAIAKSCMWGQGGLGMVILDELQRVCPTDQAHSWRAVHDAHEKEARREAVGVVTSEEEIKYYIRERYYLCNYQPGELSIHYPSHIGGGLCKYVVGELAEKFGPIYDPHNWEVFQKRASANG